MSHTASFYTVAAAFRAAEEAFLGANVTWRSVNQPQERFLQEAYGVCRNEVPKIKEIETIAALSEVPINKFLRERNFDIQLDQFPELTPPERAWGAAAVLDALVNWKVRGKKATIVTKDKRSFPGVHLVENTVKFFRTRGHPYPIAVVETKTSDRVLMSMFDESLEHFDLLAKAEQLSRSKTYSGKYEGLEFPMVDLDHKVDISWLKGMWTIDNEGYHNKLTQALQQTKFKMNEEGARVKDAVAIGGVRTISIHIPRPPHIINQPFLIWFERPGLSKPLFVGYITQENWKDPGSLATM